MFVPAVHTVLLLRGEGQISQCLRVEGLLLPLPFIFFCQGPLLLSMVITGSVVRNETLGGLPREAKNIPSWFTY